MERISLKILLCGLLIFFGSVHVDAAQIQLFGIRNLDGILSLEYENLEQGYAGLTKTDTALQQKYRLSADTFVLHPKFLSWTMHGEFGARKRNDVTELMNNSYGTSIRLLRDYFISTGFNYYTGQDEIKQAYAPSYTRDRTEQSADLSLRLRSFPSTFSYRKVDLTSTAAGHEEDSTETRLGFSSNIRLKSGIHGTLRLNQVEKVNSLKPGENEYRYVDANLSNSWSSKDRKVSWSSGIRTYQRQLPTTSTSLSINESVNYRGDKLGSGIRLSLSTNDESDLTEKRLGGAWNTTYKFTDQLNSRVNLDVNRLEYLRSTSSDYLQNRYNLDGRLEYRVKRDDYSYYATGSAGYVQRDVEGGGTYSSYEIICFDEYTTRIRLKTPGITEIEEVTNRDDTSITYEYGLAWTSEVDANGYVIITRHEPNVGDDPAEFIPDDVEIIVKFRYTPRQDGKEVKGSVKVGLNKDLGSKVHLTSRLTGDIRKDLLYEDRDVDLGHEFYLGARANINDRLSFSGSLTNRDDGSTLSTEAKFARGAFELTGRYGADIYPGLDPRHNLSVDSRWSTYIPIGIRLTLTVTEKRAYRNGQMLNGDFNFTASARYALRRYMWLRNDYKMSLNHLVDGLRWSNVTGFEWKQGLLSLNAGFELVGNEITNYESTKFTIKVSRRF